MPLIPARFRKPDPAARQREALRKDVSAVVTTVKAMQGVGRGRPGIPAGVTPAMPGSQFQGGWNNLGNSSMAMLQRVTENMSRQHNVPVAEIESQLIEQGLTWGPPFPPGRPLDPFFGFRRPPRTWDYTVGENVQLTPRWQRISFDTIKAIYDNYDVAQICLAPGIDVVTKRGLVAIENVEVGDEVLTHRGRFRRVYKTMASPIGDRGARRVQAGGLEPIITTADHPFLAVHYRRGYPNRRVMESLDWVEAQDLRPRGTKGGAPARYDAAVLPALSFDDAENYLDLPEVLGSDFEDDDGQLVQYYESKGRGTVVARRRTRIATLSSRLPLNYRFGRLVGWYLAEGCGGGSRGVTFTLAKHETVEAQEICSIAKELFGVDGRIKSRVDESTISVQISSRPLGNLLDCGHARTKRVPEWAWSAPREFMDGMLGAWIDGDGCRVTRDDNLVGVTASKTLAWQMRMIAIALGHKPVLTTSNHPGRVAYKSDRTPIYSGPVHYTVGWRVNPKRTGRYSFEEGGRILATAIKTVDQAIYDGTVYNIEVEDDHSYVTTGGTVHNCVRHLINDVRSLDFDWVPNPGERDDVSGDIDKARAFFAYPDKAQPFRNWLAEWLQDVLRYDAGALYVHRTNAGDPYALEVVTGASLIPLIDFYGRVAADRDETDIPQEGIWPGGDTPGYLQIIEGMPWDWLTVDDVIYQPWNPLPESQYGLAPLESILLTANTDIRFQQHFLEYFCYDEQTEVLTRNGWRRFDEVDGSEEFATRSADGEFEWQRTNDGKVHRFDYNGELVGFSNRCVDQLVTPNHRMLTRRVAGSGSRNPDEASYEWHIRRADWFVENPTAEFQLPVTSSWEGSNPERFVIAAQRAERRHPARERALEAVMAIMATRELIPASEGIAACAAAGVSGHAVKYARDQLGIEVECHGVPGRKCGKRWMWRRRGPLACPPQPNGEYHVAAGIDMPFTAWAGLLGLYIAEGCRRARRWEVTIAQTDQGKPDQVREILAATGLNWYEGKNGGFSVGSKALYTALEGVGDRSWLKRLPDEALDWSREAIDALLHGLHVGDGHVTYSGQRVYTTTSKILAGQVQVLWQKLGVYAGVWEKEPPSEWSKRKQYIVRNRPEKAFRVPRPHLVPYKGVVSCVSVPNGIILTRRNGKAVWSGNTAGTLPAGFMEAPQDLSDPAMVAELQETWDAMMSGDQEMLRRIRFVPFGSKFTPVKNSDFDENFPLYLMRRVAAAYGITPANLGFTETVNRATSDTQVDIQWRVGTLPLVRHVEDVINLFVAQHLGLRCRLQFDKGQEVEDRLMTMQAHQGYVDMGAMSVDEVRAELGKPIDRARPIPRMINNARLGPIPLIAIESMSGEVDRETYAPDAKQPLIPNPYIGTPGVVPPMGSPEAKAAALSAQQMQRSMLQATTGQGPTPEMQAAIAAANPPKPASGGSSQGPEGTTAQPAEVPPGQGAGSRPEPSQAAQTASKEYMPQFDDEAVSWCAPNGEKKIGYVQMVGENGDVALADEPGGEAMYLIPFQQIDPEDGPYVEVSPNVFEAAKSRRAAWLAKDGLGGGGSGIYSSGSGIQGSPLASGSGVPDDDDDDETSELYGYNEEWKAAKSLDALLDLRRWRENARNRIRKGQSPRPFRSTSIPPDVQSYIWGRLEKAESRREVNAIFADVVAGRPFGVGRTSRARGSGHPASKASAGTVSAGSGMVSLDIAPGTLPTLDDGVSDQHITIVFIGKGVSDDLFDRVCERAQQVAASMAPPSGTIGGLGQFPPSESSDWMIPVFAIPDVPAAEILRAHFEDFNASEHADYHPHVTLGYFASGEQLPDPVPETPVSFSHLSVHRGDDVRRFPFKGASKAVGEKADEDDFAGVMAGGLIVQAQDTGRVLMIQRLPDKHDDDAAYARWEWPGGCLDVDDQGVWQGALREWEEETGATLDEDARHVGSFLSQQGNYQAYVIQVPSENDLDFDPQPEEVADIGWWDPADLTDGRVRDKVSENLGPLQRFLAGSVGKATAAIRPPNLRQTASATRNCHTCRWMGANGLCLLPTGGGIANWPVDRDEVCDRWTAKVAKASAASIHRHTDRIVAHYQPLIAQAFEDLFPQDALREAIEQVRAGSVTKYSDDEARDDHGPAA